MPDLSPSTLNQFTDPSAGLFPPLDPGMTSNRGPQMPIDPGMTVGNGSPGLDPGMTPQFNPVSPADLLNKLLTTGLQHGAYDSSKDFEAYLQKLQEASQATSPLELQAQQLTEQAKAARGYADYSQANPLPPPQQFTSPERSPLQLPGVPQNAQPSPNPIASLGAGLAGLFAPAAAGMFGAEALSGAITATNRLNAANNEKYKFDLEQSLLKHQDDVAREDAQAKVKAQNTALTNAYTAEQHSANLEAAKARFEAAQLDGEAGNVKKFVEGNKPAELAKAQGEAIREKIDVLTKQSENEMNRITRAAELLVHNDELLSLERDRQDKAEADRKEKAREFDSREKENEYYHRESIKAREKIAHDSDFTRLQAAHIRANESGRAGTMHHKNPEEESAWQDVQKTSREATHQWNRVTAPATNDPDIDNPRKRYQDATEAQQAYENAKTAYKQVNAADPSWNRVGPATVTGVKSLPGTKGGKHYSFDPATGQFVPR